MASKRTELITQRDELCKSYIEYDGNDRMEYVYTARTDAAHGIACSRTQYVYDGISSRIVKMKESQATWDETWDI